MTKRKADICDLWWQEEEHILWNKGNPSQISMNSDKYLLEESLQQCLTQMKDRNSPECELYERRDFLPALARAEKITKNPETTH